MTLLLMQRVWVFINFILNYTNNIVGNKRYMTEEEERLICEGKNHEHTQAAVHTSRLELLFRAYYYLGPVVEKLTAAAGKVMKFNF